MDALLITDNPQDEAILAHALRLIGLRVQSAVDLKTGLARWHERPVDLVLVALRLRDPQASVQEIRRTVDAALILVIDPVSEDCHVNLVEHGADWVVQRPYSVRLLLAYAKAILRRQGELPRERQPDLLSYASVHLNTANRTVRVGANAPQRLSQLEYRLLHTLMQHRGQVLPTDTIVEHVWGYTGDGDRSLVRGLINRLRMKIESDPHQPLHILTVPGVGYTFAEDRPKQPSERAPAS